MEDGDAPGAARRRSRAPWWERGVEPDARFTLANERTFLAWLRTGLALLAGAVAMVQLVPPFGVPGLRTALGALLALDGLAVLAAAYPRWAGNERALRSSQGLPHSRLPLLLAGSLLLAGVLVLVAVLVPR